MKPCMLHVFATFDAGGPQVRTIEVLKAAVQLMGFYGEQKLVDGEISRWRFQAERISITPEGWKAERAAFSMRCTTQKSWMRREHVPPRSPCVGCFA